MGPSEVEDSLQIKMPCHSLSVINEDGWQAASREIQIFLVLIYHFSFFYIFSPFFLFGFGFSFFFID